MNKKYKVGLIAVFLSAYFAAPSAIAEVGSPNIFGVEVGLTSVSLSESETYGRGGVSSTMWAAKVGLLYQFSGDWGVSANTIVGLQAGTHLYTFEGFRIVQLNESFDLNLSAGLMYGATDEYTVNCRQFGGGYFDDGTDLCAGRDTPLIEQQIDHYTSFTVGVAASYRLSENWKAVLGYEYSGFKEGASQYEISMRYYF